MLPRILFITLLFIKCISGQSATYYFSSSLGDDSRSYEEAQKSETPWQSIQKLNILLRAIRPGDSILFKNGDTFHGTINIVKSGTSKSPIYFGNFGSGSKPTLSGLKNITSWISKGGNLYEASIPELSTPISVVLINEEIHSMGRFPNKTDQNGGYLTIKSYNEGSIMTSTFKMSSNYTGGEIVIRKNNWIIDRHLINSNTLNRIDYNNYEKEIPPMIGYGFFIQNHPSTLDKHGEWYFDRVNKKILIYYIGNPINENIKVATVSELINIQYKASNILFENLSLEGSNKNLINISGSSNLKFENCNLEFIGENGINAVSSQNIIISNSSIKNSLNGGVFLGWNDLGLIIKNSTFENIFNFEGMGKNGEMQSQAIYMSETTSDVLIEETKFFNCGYNAINFSGNNILIKNNLIDTFCFIKDDGAGIYTFTGPAKTPFTNRKIIGNIIINGIGAVLGTKPYGANDLPYVEGIYLDTFVSGVDIENNSIANVKSKGIFLNNSKNINITNNKILNTGYSIYLKSDNTEDPSENIVVKNNQFLAITDSQIHFYIRTNFDNIFKLGDFDENIFSRPLNNSKSIYLETPSKNGYIDLLTWKKDYILDKNSSKGPVENLQFHPSELKSSKIDDSILFEYNFSNSIKTVSLNETYTNLRGNIASGNIEILPYSSILLLKSKKAP